MFAESLFKSTGNQEKKIKSQWERMQLATLI